jgi:hypothetical protein
MCEKMPPKTLIALKASIEKWERWARGKYHDNDVLGITGCPLCYLFYDAKSNPELEFDGCHGCPVSARTGKAFCDGSPYDIISATVYGPSSAISDLVDIPQFLKHAAAELKFLKSLLPKNE